MASSAVRFDGNFMEETRHGSGTRTRKIWVDKAARLERGGKRKIGRRVCEDDQSTTSGVFMWDPAATLCKEDRAAL